MLRFSSLLSASTRFKGIRFFNSQKLHEPFLDPFKNILGSTMTDLQKASWLQEQAEVLKDKVKLLGSEISSETRKDIVTDVTALISGWTNKAAKKNTVLQSEIDQIMCTVKQLSEDAKAETAPQQNPSPTQTPFSHPIGC
jgi:hypothetical protein